MVLLISGLIIISLLLGTILWRFLNWRKALIRKLNQNSVVLETEKGPIEYCIHGSNGDYVLFLHGAPGGYDQYGIHRNPFFARYRVIAISRFGYLRTPLSTAMNLPDQADAIAAFLDALNINKIIVSAGSGGGPLALAFAAYHPDRVSRMVLYAVASQAMDLDDNRPGVKILKAISRSDFLSWLLLVRLMRKPEKLVGMLIKDPSHRQHIMASGQAEQFAQAMSVMLPPSLRIQGMDNDEKIFKFLDIPKHLITAPTLILHGDQDEHVAYEQSRRLQQQLPNSRLVTIEGGDHFMGYTHSDLLERHYREFFNPSDSTVLG